MQNLFQLFKCDRKKREHFEQRMKKKTENNTKWKIITMKMHYSISVFVFHHSFFQFLIFSFLTLVTSLHEYFMNRYIVGSLALLTVEVPAEKEGAKHRLQLGTFEWIHDWIWFIGVYRRRIRCVHKRKQKRLSFMRRVNRWLDVYFLVLWIINSTKFDFRSNLIIFIRFLHIDTCI